jgi:hypothetical protein
MSDELKKWSRACIWAVVGLLGLLALYPLSSGPAFWLSCRLGDLHPRVGTHCFHAVEAAYAPFWKLLEQYKWAESAMDSYVDFWIRLLPGNSD